jgi:hypothetical protein
MATRNLEIANLGPLPDSFLSSSSSLTPNLTPNLLTSTLLMSGHSTPLRLTRAQQFGEFGSPASAQLDGNNIARCIGWAFAIEGGAALLILGCWALWRLWM